MADPRMRREPVVVVGLGRFGSALATELARRGTEVLGIDNRPEIVQRMADQLTHVVRLDSTDIEALRQVDVPEYNRAVVAIGTDIEASILTTSMLVELEIEHIWAKAITVQHGRILERIGAHHVVFPEHDMGERVAHLVHAKLLDYVEIANDFAMVKSSPPRELVGVPLGEARLLTKHRVRVVAVKAEHDEDFEHATAETVVRYGDVIVVVGKIDDVERFAAAI